MPVPTWVQDAIIYQIFPDRFFNGNPENDPPNVKPWGTPPTLRNFMGGDLVGIINKFDYLLDLGVNTLYLNPIFKAAANHRYNTTDYYHIDPTLGTMADFQALLVKAHDCGVKVILDGVFNHCGRGFFAFSDVLENGWESRYKDWFYINKYPLNAYTNGPARNYEAWWKIKDLPKFNVDNPPTRKYILDVARYWIEQGIDGWRLDVPGEIDNDPFWAEFRQVVKTVNPEAYLLGEIWELDSRWVGDNHFDGLMHYPLRSAVFDLLKGETTPTGFAGRLDQFVSAYPKENLHAMYLTLGTHDTRRLVNIMEGNMDKVRLAFLLQFAMPGAPAIYYGDEVGLEGEKDPDNRRAFPWDEGEWNHELRAFVKKLISLRKDMPALHQGNMQTIYTHDELNGFALAPDHQNMDPRGYREWRYSTTGSYQASRRQSLSDHHSRQ